MTGERGRPRGSRATGIPTCSLHPGSVVTLAGHYGKNNDRQRYRCRPSDSQRVHKFAGDVPRLLAPSHHCDHCDSKVPAHLGPPVARNYLFPVEQAADALLMVGQGVSYTEAAQRSRTRAGRESIYVGAQLVANWVEVLGPVVCASHRPDAWPETVVLDSTNFFVTNSRTGARSQAFAVLGAWGYEQGKKTGQAWAFMALHQATEPDWVTFLQSLPGEPVLVIIDNRPEIRNAAQVVWPSAFVKLCEHHLRETAMKRMKAHGETKFGSPGMALLNDAFRSPKGWRAYKSYSRDFADLDRWVTSMDLIVSEQVRRRIQLPQHHSSGAIDPALAKIRSFMKSRAFCYRNAERTNRMLELVRLRLNLADNSDQYTLAIRRHLDDNGGRLGVQGQIQDHNGHQSLRV
jgi:hypothetical protein